MSSDFTSRTARAPARHYKRRLAISHHAIERFRERVDEEFRHRNDEDLSNLLDERISYAEFNYEVRDPRAPDDITTLRSVACHHATYYAVVRNETVITVLDEEMARNNFSTQWSPVLNAPFAALRGLKIPPPPRLPASSADPQPAVLPAQPAPITEEDPLAAAGVAYARARKHKHACATTAATLKADLDRALEALLQAELAVEDTHRQLVDLVGEEEPTT